jgi:hypothetical protein
MHEADPNLNAPTRRLKLEEPKVHHLPHWSKLGEDGKLRVIRKIIHQYGRDPRIASKAVEIVKAAGVPPRDYLGQQQALLQWVQENIYYVNEPGERLQSPLYTLKVGYGDCDDMVIVLASFLESMRFSWKLVISGPAKAGNNVIRFVEGENPAKLKLARWSHIYLMVGDKPFKPGNWNYAEPTLRGATLGWDVVNSGGKLPEFGMTDASQLAVAYSHGRKSEAGIKFIDWNSVKQAVVTGVLAALVGGMIVDIVRGEKTATKAARSVLT